MCLLQEPYASVSLAGDMESAGGSLFSAGPSQDTILASVSPLSVALLKLEESRPLRFWFTKPTTPFTTTAVWDSSAHKIVSASYGKVLAWTNSEKATPTLIAQCPTAVLCFLPSALGIVVVCENGLVFRLSYDRSNWSEQIAPSVRSTFSWAALINNKEHIMLLTDDGKSVVRFPVDDCACRTIVKAPPKFIVSACCVHDDMLYAANLQGKVLRIEKESFISSKIDLKMEKNQLTALLSSGQYLLLASKTMVSLWDTKFGLMKNNLKISFHIWTQKCIVLSGKALFASSSLMILPIKVQKFSLASLVGTRKKSEKKTAICFDACEAAASNVASWTVFDVQKLTRELDDFSEDLIVKCWKKLSEAPGDLSQNCKPLLKLIATRHNCKALTPVLHEFLTLEDVQKSINFVACCMADVTLFQLNRGLLESLMDWACHLVDAHRNAIKVSLLADNDATESCLLKLNQNIHRVQLLTDDLQSCQHDIKVFLGKSDEVVAPREKLYWVEPFEFLNKS